MNGQVEQILYMYNRFNNLHASVGNGGENPAKNGPGGASFAISPPGKFGGVTAIGWSLGPPPPGNLEFHKNDPCKSFNQNMRLSKLKMHLTLRFPEDRNDHKYEQQFHYSVSE